jgi:hypothetical protein
MAYETHDAATYGPLRFHRGSQLALVLALYKTGRKLSAYFNGGRSD